MSLKPTGWAVLFFAANIALPSVSVAAGVSEIPTHLVEAATLKAPDFAATIDAAAIAQATAAVPRKRLASFAMKFRDIRYRRAGREPSTGFDCSGFTHYIYSQTYGLDLPYDAPSQFETTQGVDRDQMRVGDLVFFHQGRYITHVGMYLGDGQFIHSPRPGKRVRVDELDSPYWAANFAGARRPNVSGLMMNTSLNAQQDFSEFKSSTDDPVVVSSNKFRHASAKGKHGVVVAARKKSTSKTTTAPRSRSTHRVTLAAK